PLLDQNQIARAHQAGNLAGLVGRAQVAGLNFRASAPGEERERCQHQSRSESGANNPPCRAWPCPAKLRPLSYGLAEPMEILNRQALLPEAGRAFPSRACHDWALRRAAPWRRDINAYTGMPLITIRRPGQV